MLCVINWEFKCNNFLHRLLLMLLNKKKNRVAIVLYRLLKMQVSPTYWCSLHLPQHRSVTHLVQLNKWLINEPFFSITLFYLRTQKAKTSTLRISEILFAVLVYSCSFWRFLHVNYFHTALNCFYVDNYYIVAGSWFFLLSCWLLFFCIVVYSKK